MRFVGGGEGGEDRIRNHPPNEHGVLRASSAIKSGSPFRSCANTRADNVQSNNEKLCPKALQKIMLKSEKKVINKKMIGKKSTPATTIPPTPT